MDYKKLHLWLIRLIGLIVPRRLRADWRQEWEAELQYREEMLAAWERLTWRNKLDLLRRSASAFWDAMVLQPKRWEDEMIQDLRFGIRMLLKHKGFTFIAVLTLALGIGANTAIFSVIKAVLLGTMPYQDAERLVMLWENDTLEGNARNNVAPGNFGDWRKQNEVCTELAYYAQPESVNVTGNNEPERLVGIGVSANLFALLGAQPLLGRTFLPMKAGQATNDRLEVVLSYGLWQRRFGGDPSVIGKTLTFDSVVVCTIVGVMPAQFQLPEEAEMWWQTLNGELSNRDRFFLRALGRLKPGITMQQAQASFTLIAERLEQQYPATNKGRGINVVTFRDQLVGDVRLALWLLFGAVGFVLLIACANVANLLLARGAARGKEMAVRAALGASRTRLLRQSLTESLLLSVAGGALGLLLAYWSVQGLTALSPIKTLQPQTMTIDAVMLGFTCLLTLLTGIVCGLAPAWQLSQSGLHDTLKEGGRSTADNPRQRRVRNLLVVSEVALAVVLLAGAGLLIRSFRQLQSVDAGFDPHHLLTMQFSLTGLKYDDSTQIAAGYRRLLERLAVVPGVQSVAAVSRLPLAGDRATSGLVIEGRLNEGAEVHYRVATPGYFGVLGIPLRAGRNLSEQDNEGQPGAVVINETMARRYWPKENALGKRIRLGPNTKAPWLEIVGIAADARNFGLDSEARPEVYVSYQQSPSERMRILLRTVPEPTSMMTAIRAAVREFDQDLPFSQALTMEQLHGKSIAQRRMNMLLLTLFAGLALLLASVGIYGVIAYAVTQRTREIGLRLALGAQPGNVLKLVIGQGMKLALIGLVLGLSGALALTRLLKTLLFGVSATDPLTFILTAMFLLFASLLACWLPARRAAKVDPMVTLRHD